MEYFVEGIEIFQNKGTDSFSLYKKGNLLNSLQEKVSVPFFHSSGRILSFLDCPPQSLYIALQLAIKGIVSMSSVQPVFIFGYAHSGTTLLQNMFKQHGDVLIGMSETYFYEFPYLYMDDYPELDTDEAIDGMIRFCANLMLKGYWRLYAHKTEQPAPDIVSTDDLNAIKATLGSHPTHAEIFHRTLDQLAVREGLGFWVEKTPGHTNHAQRILTDNPGAKAIALVRNPKDILSSKKLREKRVHDKIQSGEATYQDKNNRGMIEYDPFWTSLAWRAAARAILDAENAYPDRILTIRYEDIVQDAEGQLKTICNFLGLEYRDTMLQVDRYNVATWGKEDRNQSAGVVKDSVERWRTSLSTGEAALADRLLFNELKRFEYPVDVLNQRQRFASVFTLIGSVPNLGRRMVNKLRFQGAKHAMATGKNYLSRLVRK